MLGIQKRGSGAQSWLEHWVILAVLSIIVGVAAGLLIGLVSQHKSSSETTSTAGS